MATFYRTGLSQLVALLLALLSASGMSAKTSSGGIDELSETDRQLLHNAVELVDGGMSESAMEDFDILANKYPKNYIVRYERAYALYTLRRYDDVIKEQKFLLKSKEANELTYQLVGNAYDMTGERKKAAGIYSDGLKKFPDSGPLHLELGNLCFLDHEYFKAIDYYNKGIVVAPNFASNYYQAATLYFMLDDWKVWGLVYAETEILLAPSNEGRHRHMASLIVDCFRESISLDYGDNPTLSVSLVPERALNFNTDTNIVYLGFPGVYEGALDQPLFKMFMDKEPFTGSLPQLIELRRGAVEAYYSATDNIYGSSMYLLEFQKKVIDAGHWEAYNYYILGPGYDDDVFGDWYEAHEEEFDAFVEWYNAAPFRLGDGRSVDPRQIYDHYRPVDLMQAMTIQAGLLIDTKMVKEASAEEDVE